MLSSLPRFTSDSAGDFLIRTSDGADFNVHKKVVAGASSVFYTMLSLPQAPSERPGVTPSVEVTECSAVWSGILALLYSSAPPTITEPRTAYVLLEAGRKYDMPDFMESIRRALLDPTVISSHPIAYYALGWEYDLVDVAEAAARAYSKTPTCSDSHPKPDFISPGQWQSLLDYKRRCGIAAQDAVTLLLLILHKRTSLLCWTPRQLRLLARDCCEDSLSMSGRPRKAGCKSTMMAFVQGFGPGGVEFITCDVREAWFEYMRGLHQRLLVTPDPDVALCPTLLQPVVDSAQGCETCMKTIRSKSEELAAVIREKIERAIAQVPLKT